MSQARKALKPAEEALIITAIKQAELSSSGEIRVHLESRCRGDVMDRAATVFEKLEMHKTRLRNGVLFYLAVDDHKFAVLGDGGINAVVPDDFWEKVKETMLGFFTGGDIAGGLSEGILMAGEQLRQYFPYQQDDKNELSDEISYS